MEEMKEKSEGREEKEAINREGVEGREEDGKKERKAKMAARVSFSRKGEAAREVYGERKEERSEGEKETGRERL